MCEFTCWPTFLEPLSREVHALTVETPVDPKASLHLGALIGVHPAPRPAWTLPASPECLSS